jgi:hypothetical protein
VNATIAASSVRRGGRYSDRHSFGTGLARPRRGLAASAGANHVLASADTMNLLPNPVLQNGWVIGDLGLAYDIHHAAPFRSWRIIGRCGTRRATVLNPARAKVVAVPVKRFDVHFGTAVSTG